MSGHTPGPWRKHDDGVSPMHRYVIGAFGKTVAYLYCTKGDEKEDEANARLIAAAPDLLEALIEMEKAFGTEIAGGPAVRARAAIIKATKGTDV